MEEIFDATLVAETHSALTGVLAGFALAGVFLIIERVKENAQYLKAMLLLFVAFLTGTMSSFLYSTIVGDPSKRALLLFQLPSAIFAIQAMLLLSGITFIFSAFGVRNILRYARHISYLIVGFCVATICSDLVNVSIAFDFDSSFRIWLIIIASIPILMSLAVLIFKINKARDWLKNKSFGPFCYVAIIISLIIGSTQTYYRYFPEEIIRFHFWIPVFLMSSVSILGAWAVLIFPQSSVASKKS